MWAAKRGPLALRAPDSLTRNLIALTFRAFKSPTELLEMPIAPSSTPALHHTALASQGRTGDPDSPASSFTSEHPSLADVQEGDHRASTSGASGTTPRKGVLSAVGRKLSFDRSKSRK